MNVDEAYTLWDDLDNYRYGYVSSNLMSRWMADNAEFNLPAEDQHFLYDCFGAREVHGRIDDNQFITELCGP
jgi:hypothetical protein